MALDSQASGYARASNDELLRSLNEAWTKIRALEKELAKKDEAIAVLRHELAQSNKRTRRYRISTIALTSVITGLAWKGVEALADLLK